MSYCRFGENSDVYAYEDYMGGIQVWTVGGAHDMHCATPYEAYVYIRNLRDLHGLKVPDSALECLAWEAGPALARAEAVRRLESCDCHTTLDLIALLLPDLKARSPRRIRDGLVWLLGDGPLESGAPDS